MTYTEKVLAEFEEKFGALLDMLEKLYGGNPEEMTTFKEALKSFLSTSIHQARAEERSKAWEGEAVKQAYIQGKSHGISEEYERMRGEIWGMKGMVANPDYFIRVQRELRGNQATEGLDDRVITQIVWVAKDRVLDDLLSSLPLSTNQKEV